MADTAVKPTTPAKTPKKPKASKAQAKPLHPPYKTMILAAIKDLKEKSGSSRQAILKYINAHYKVGDEKKAGNRLRLALRKLVDSGELKSVKGAGASGSFRIAKDEAAAKPKKPAAKKAAKPKKPAAAKKPAAKAAKKATPKKAAAKKPAAAAAVAPAAKKSPKKPVAKKAKSPKKPAAKKVAKKPAAKKVAKK